MNATEQIREDQALGAAWRRAEAALPKGWVLEAHRRPDCCQAEAWNFDGGTSKGRVYLFGDSPIAALTALADALESRSR